MVEKKSTIVISKIEDKSTGLQIDDVGVVKEKTNTGCIVFFIRIKKTLTINNDSFFDADPNHYGDAYDNKVCNVCHKVHPTSFFDLNQNGKNNRPVRRPSCKNCRKVIDGVNMSSAEKKKWTAIKPDSTDFTCPICDKTTIPGLTSKVVLNHDHDTGKIYGWICDSCNTGLGRFKDDVALLQKAIKFLE